MRGHYSRKDVSQLVSYARLRGVRVVPEVDLPGHTKAIVAALGPGARAHTLGEWEGVGSGGDVDEIASV